MPNSKNYILAFNLFFLIMLFPYISFVKTPFDLQIWPLAFASALLLIVSPRKFNLWPKSIKMMSIMALYAIAFFLVFWLSGRADLITGMRALVGYVSLTFFAFLAYLTFDKINISYFKIAVTGWGLGGLLQLIFGPEILAGVISRLSTGTTESQIRGLTSFSPEPAVYAFVCISMIVLNEIFYAKKKYTSFEYFVINFLLILQILLTFSGLGLALVASFLVVKFIGLILTKFDKKEVLFLLSYSIFIGCFLFLNNTGDVSKDITTKEYRAEHVIKQITSHPTEFIKNDLGVSLRLFNPVIGIYGGLVETKGFGFGPGRIKDEPISNWLSGLIGLQRNWGGQIMGGFSGAIYEIGIVGLFMTLLIFWIIWKSFKKESPMIVPFLYSLVLLFLPTFIFGSLAFPALGYILGIHLYYGEEKVDPV